MADDDQVDLTPMVDVTFLLLIFFMVTAAFALQKSIEVPPTEEDEAAESRTIDDFAEDSIVVRIDGDNVYWIGCPAWSEEKEAFSRHDLLATLRAAHSESASRRSSPVTRMLVLASEDATHEKVVAALDAGSDIGMEQVQLSTVEDEGY